ncbi:MAG: LysR family transcriptional regulator, partial [Bradyrhizobium sp.]|nr:LysR family transcriptional regulator [Bradyrhizobium sp.]
MRAAAERGVPQKERQEEAGSHATDVPAEISDASVALQGPGGDQIGDAGAVGAPAARAVKPAARSPSGRAAPAKAVAGKPALASLTDWDAARIFLEVVRAGSFRSAAERLTLSINAVRRRIDDFERQIGATLFTRDVHGARLTDEGALVVSAVERMETAAFELLRAGDGLAGAASGEVRVAVTEGLGTFWLAPRLVEFQQSFPNVLVDLYCAMRSADVSRHEADVAIHLSRPSALDVKLVRLGRMHLMCFASEKYLDVYGVPNTIDDLMKHRLVLQVADEAAANEAFASIFPGFEQRDLIAMT